MVCSCQPPAPTVHSSHSLISCAHCANCPAVLGAYLSGLREAKRVLGLLGVDGGYASPAAEASI